MARATSRFFSLGLYLATQWDTSGSEASFSTLYHWKDLVRNAVDADATLFLQDITYLSCAASIATGLGYNLRESLQRVSHACEQPVDQKCRHGLGKEGYGYFSHWCQILLIHMAVAKVTLLARILPDDCPFPPSGLCLADFPTVVSISILAE